MEILAQVDASLVSTFDTSCDAKEKIAGETTCASVFPRAANLNKFSNAKKPPEVTWEFCFGRSNSLARNQQINRQELDQP